MLVYFANSLGWPRRATQERRTHTSTPIEELKYSPDDRWLAVGSHDLAIDVFKFDPPDQKDTEHISKTEAELDDTAGTDDVGLLTRMMYRTSGLA